MGLDRYKPENEGEAGATMLEYALIAVLIAVACIGAAAVMGRSTSQRFSSIASEVGAAPEN